MKYKTRPRITDWEKLLNTFQDLDAPITGAQAMAICKKHLGGKRVFCSNTMSHSGFKTAEKLINQGLNRTEATSLLVDRLNYSRQWATTLINYAINQKYENTLLKAQ